MLNDFLVYPAFTNFKLTNDHDQLLNLQFMIIDNKWFNQRNYTDKTCSNNLKEYIISEKLLKYTVKTVSGRTNLN